MAVMLSVAYAFYLFGLVPSLSTARSACLQSHPLVFLAGQEGEREGNSSSLALSFMAQGLLQVSGTCLSTSSLYDLEYHPVVKCGRDSH